MSTNVHRVRAEHMVEADMTDRQIDEAIQLSDHADRIVIWQYVLELRAATPIGPEPVRGDVTPEGVKAERRRRRDAGEPYGYDALAKHFHVDASTIRRRLGKLTAK